MKNNNAIEQEKKIVIKWYNHKEISSAPLLLMGFDSGAGRNFAEATPESKSVAAEGIETE